MITSSEFAKTLDEIRIKEKLTIENFCDGVMSRKKFTRLLNGEADFSFEEIIKLTGKLSITFQEFYLYIVTKIEHENSFENSFYLSVVAGDYAKAYNEYYPLFKGKSGVGILSKRGLPALIELTKYKLNKQDKIVTLAHLRLLAPLDKLITKKIVDDETIIVLYAYSFVCGPKELRLISHYIVRLIKEKDIKFLLAFSEQSFNLLYNLGVMLHNKLNKLTVEDEENLWIIIKAALEYQTKARTIIADYVFFKTLYELLLKQKHKNRYVTFYYIASYLSLPKELQNGSIMVDDEDIHHFQALLSDNAFIYHPMYEDLINGHAT